MTNERSYRPRLADAYTYLPNSVTRFPGPQDLAQRLAATGLDEFQYLLAAGGITAIHAGGKPRED